MSEALADMLPLSAALEAAELLTRRQANDGLRAAIQDWDEETRTGIFPHQRAYLDSTKDEAWLFGANRSGKTEALAILIATYARFGVLDPREAYAPGFVFKGPKRIWAVSLNFDMSRNILQAKLFNNGARVDPRPALIPDEEIASWNITNQTLRLKNGSIIIFKSADAGRDAFQGADCDLIGPDEVPPEEVYTESTLRIGGGRKLLIRGAATILPPPGVPGGVSWMFLAKAQPWLALGPTTEARNAASPKLDIFTAGMADNKTILAEEIDRLATIFAPGSPEYMIRVLGHLLPSIGGALCYPAFNRTYHLVEGLAPQDADGNRYPAVNPYLPLCLNVDFNPENGVWTIGQRQGQIFRVLDEITLERSDIASMCAEFRMRYPAHQAEVWIHGDASGRRKEGQTGMSSFHLMAQYLGGYPAPLRFNLPDVNPPVKDRVDAVNLQLRPPTGMRLFEISPACVETLADLEGTKWDSKGKIDKRHGRRSDGMDTIGYWIFFAAPTRAPFATSGGLKSVKRPSYFKSGAFPASRSNMSLYSRRARG
jgi:phage terminase large subunit-like protein